MIRLLSLLLIPFLALSACADPSTPEPEAEILVMGDSLMTWHALSERAIPDVLARSLNTRVQNRATAAARMIYKLPVTGAAGLNIPKQFRPGPWKWIILNGGGNDLWLGCGCHRCTRKLNRLISPDATSGTIPDLLMKLRGTGARVLYMGYLRTPGHDSPIDACKEAGDALEARVEQYAAAHSGVDFVSLVDLVPHGDLSFHALDRVHPSVKGSEAIGQRLAEKIRSLEEQE